MARIAILDPAHPSGVADLVSDYLPSAHTPDYVGNPDALINPDVSAVAAVERLYWQGNRGGNSIVEMSVGDKATLDAWIAAEAEAAMRAGGQALFDGQTTFGQAFRALIKVTLDEINALRSQHALAPRTLAQVKTAIQGAVQNGDVDE